eukprot:scaffold5610_cov137-Isochrysis_galbana.AAC.7
MGREHKDMPAPLSKAQRCPPWRWTTPFVGSPRPYRRSANSLMFCFVLNGTAGWRYDTNFSRKGPARDEGWGFSTLRSKEQGGLWGPGVGPPLPLSRDVPGGFGGNKYYVLHRAPPRAAKFSPITVTDVQSDGRPRAVPRGPHGALPLRYAVAAAGPSR